MHLVIYLILFIAHPFSPAHAEPSPADAYFAKEMHIAKAGLFANIGPTGAKCQGAKAGIVIASPSSRDPDYLYTWTRDSSLVFQAIIDQVTLGIDPSLRPYIDDFVAAQKVIQQIKNPSGTIFTGGLGEPKFHIDETAFTDGWGRPQRDGPALRANALITWANYLLKQNNATYVTSVLWEIIELDLDFVSENWNKTGYDLWEEVSSSSFFTTAVQHRSLRQGALLAAAIGQTALVTKYTAQADNLLCFLQSYWNPTENYVTANTGGGRSGKDANPVLTSIHTFDPSAGCDSITFQPCSDHALANLFTYVNAFKTIYKINAGAAASQGVATGRYPEDGYMGGNPWYLTTLAVAEQLYDSVIVWNRLGSVNVTALSLPFFCALVPDAAIGTYDSSTPMFTTLTTAVANYADSFVSVVSKYTPSSGGLSEQYSRNTGMPMSAVDLTWSYASLLTAAGAKLGLAPASWGANGLTVPGTCLRGGGSSVGSGGGGGSAGGGGSGASGGSGTVKLTFNVQASTVLGENIYLTGSVGALKNWSPGDSILLSPTKYPIWSVTVVVPASSSIQYKYIRKYKGGIRWESDPNMEVSTISSGSQLVNDVWR